MTDDELKDLVIAQKKTDEKIQYLLEKVEYIDVMLGNISEMTTDFLYTPEEEVDKFFYRYFIETKCLHSLNFDAFQKMGSGDLNVTLINEIEKYLVLVDANFKIKKEKIADLARKNRAFKDKNPHYKEYKQYCAIAVFHIDSDTKQEALNQGFFVLQRSGDVIHTDCGQNLRVM
jgi:hypothetical protein